MDPNATLDMLRQAVSDYEDKRGDKVDTDADDMRDYFRALDDWMSAGGDLPDAWRCK